MRTRSKFAAAIAVAALSLGGVLASATAASAALPDGTLSIHTPLIKPNVGYEGDVVFSGTGWTPDHPVIVELLSVIGPWGPTVLSSHTVTADQGGAIAGSWTPSTFLLGSEFAFTAREEATPANGDQTRSSNVVPLLVSPTPGVSLRTGSFFPLNFTEGDATWGGGIEFESSGWTPGATVLVGVNRWTDINTVETDAGIWVADQDGIVEGVWQSTSLVPELASPTGYPAFDFQAVEVDADGSAVKASGAHDLAIVRSGAAPIIEVVNPVYPPGSFTRGIQVEGSGFTPGADVTVYFWVAFEPEAAGQYHEVTQADDEGRISVLMAPNPAWPGAYLPENGYPQYVVRAGERGGNGSQIVALSNSALLSIELEPPAPVIEAPASIPADELADGVTIPFSGFEPGEIITFTLSAIIGGQSTVLEMLESEADSEGRGLLSLALTGLTGLTEIMIVGVGNASQARAEVSFTADVTDDPTDPGHPGGSGAPADVQGHLAHTGADHSTVVTIAGASTAALLLGALALVTLHRRRIAGPVTRR